MYSVLKRTVRWISKDRSRQVFFYANILEWNVIKEGFKQIYGTEYVETSAVLTIHSCGNEFIP